MKKLPAGHNQSDGVLFVGISVDANVFHQGVSLQPSLNFAQRNVFSELKLDKILLPIDQL